MKRILLSAVAVIAAVSIANADPKFGAVGYTTGGAGVYVTDDMYAAHLRFGSTSSDDIKTSTLGFGANYKIAIDNSTALTMGIDYRTISGDFSSTIEYKTNTQLDLVVGVEKSVNSNILMTAEATVYRSTELEADMTGSEKATSTALFPGGRVGVVYLF